MMMRRLFLSIVVAPALLIGMASAHVEEVGEEISGLIQNWSAETLTIRVGDVNYRMARDVVVLDRDGRVLAPARPRPGQRVLIRRIGHEVVEVIVDPLQYGVR